MKILNILKKMGICTNLMILTLTVNGASSGAGAGIGCDEESEPSRIVRRNLKSSLIDEIISIIMPLNIYDVIVKAKVITMGKHAKISSYFYDKTIKHYLQLIFAEKSVKISEYNLNESINKINEFFGTIHSSELDDIQFIKYKEIKKQISIHSFDVRTAVRRHFNSICRDNSADIHNDRFHQHTQEQIDSFLINCIFKDLLEIFL